MEQSVTNEVFLSWEWMFTWWETFQGNGKTLYILTGIDSMKELVGIAPFYMEHCGNGSTIGKNIIRFCSSVETYPDHLDVIVKREYEHTFIGAILEHLKKNDKEWDEIHLDGVKESSVIKKYLISIGKEYSYIVDYLPDSVCPFLLINQSTNHGYEPLQTNSRSTLARKRKNLLGKGGCKYGIVKGEENDPEPYLKELFSLHAARAERKGIMSTFSGDNIYDFHKRFAIRSSKDKKTTIAYIANDKAFLAIHYCMTHNNKYYIYQTGISQEGEKKSAGTVLLSILIKKAADEGCTEFDFSRGRHKYKLLWTDNARQDYSIIIQKYNLQNNAKYILSRMLIRPGKKMAKFVVLVLAQLSERWILNPVLWVLKIISSWWYVMRRMTVSNPLAHDQKNHSQDHVGPPNNEDKLYDFSLCEKNRLANRKCPYAVRIPIDDVERLLAERASARQNRNWKRADEIRVYLSQQGIELQDAPQETTWRYMDKK